MVKKNLKKKKMGEIADQLVDAHIFGGSIDPYTGEYRGQKHSGRVVQNRFNKTKNGNLFGIYNFITRKPKKFFPTTESVHLFMEHHTGIADPEKAAEKIQKDFNSFAKAVNELIKK